jgi:hypothetical protein
MSDHAKRLVQIYSELARELGCGEDDTVVRQAAPLMLTSEIMQARLIAADLPIDQHIQVSKELASINEQLVMLTALRPKPAKVIVSYVDSTICRKCEREIRPRPKLLPPPQGSRCPRSSPA